MTNGRLRLVIALGLVIATATFVVPVLMGVRLSLLGLLEAAAGSALLFGASSLALNGSRPVPLSARRALPTVLATTAANAVTPAGVGGALVTLRVHRRSGLTSDEAVAAAGLRATFGALTATAITMAAASSIGQRPASGGHGSTLMVVGVALASAAVVTVASVERWRTAVLTGARRTAVAAWRVARTPKCLAALVVGCAGVTAGQLLILEGAVRAVGAHLGWQSLLVALLGSAAARSAVPSPGGVGPIEAALVGGLTALGMGWEHAVFAVAVYRTAGHWLPVVAGVLSINALRRRHLL